MPDTPSTVTGPEPLLGRFRRVVLLPAGVGRALAVEGEGVELGNGWFDLSARLAMADPADWLPPLGWRFDLPYRLRYRAVVRGERPPAYPDEMLCDGRRNPMRELLPGTIARDKSTAQRSTPAYWLYAGAEWRVVRVIDLRPPLRDNNGPRGTIAEQIAVDDDPPEGGTQLT